MILLFLAFIVVFSIAVGMLLGAWLKSMEQEADYHEALDGLRRIRGA